jgi:hypothetical protein
MSIGAGQVTRFGIGGQIWRLAGSFAGKVADTTAPVLSLPTGLKTGSTTASGTVTTDEGNGTLYFWATISATETAAAIKSGGSSQAVSGTGIQNVSFSSLTAATIYYAHYVHDDASANESNVVNSTSFTTDAAADVSVSAPGGVGRHRKPIRLPDGRITIGDDSEIKRLLDFYKVDQETLEASFVELPMQTRRQRRVIKNKAIPAPQIIEELEEDIDLQFIVDEIARLLSA